MPFALTVDRRGSRSQAGSLDMAAHRDQLQTQLPAPVLRWQVSAGDELQALYADAGPTLSAALHLADTGLWHVGLGIGAVDTPVPATVNEATGSAFVNARTAVEASKSVAADTAVRGPQEDAMSHHANALLALLVALRRRRTDTAREAAALADDGWTQQRIAEELEITQSSVSRRLATALWQEERAAREVLVDILRRADEVNLHVE